MAGKRCSFTTVYIDTYTALLILPVRMVMNITKFTAMISALTSERQFNGA
jgi:hypothetical protein